MSGQKPPHKNHDEVLRQHDKLQADDHTAVKFFAGGTSCALLSFALNFNDVIKVRMQTEKQLGASGPRKYTGYSQTLKTIVREEGVGRGLMRGITPSMMRELSYSSMRMGFYDLFKRHLAPEAKSKADFTLVQKFTAGLGSGALGGAIANPCDLVKIRFQRYSKTKPNPYKNTFDAFVRIFKEEGGIAGLYKGTSTTVVRGAVLTGAQMSSYDTTKRYLLSLPWFDDNATCHFVSSFICALITTTAANPFDLVKTRWMTDRRKFSSPWDCALKTFAAEGPMAFFKGWVPNFSRLGPHFIFSLPLFEFIRQSLGADSV